MATYKTGQRYLRNRNTGAVFQYRPEIAKNANLVEMEANAEGQLVTVKQVPKEVQKLNPTKTPEKETPKPGAPARTAQQGASTPKQVVKPTQTNKPTMTPVDK